MWSQHKSEPSHQNHYSYKLYNYLTIYDSIIDIRCIAHLTVMLEHTMYDSFHSDSSYSNALHIHVYVTIQCVT